MTIRVSQAQTRVSRPARVTRARGVLVPLVLGLLVLALWQLAVVGFGIKPYVLPSPTAIAIQLARAFATIWAGTWVTGTNALLGLLLGAVVGILTAMVSARSRLVDQVTLPVVTAIGVVPIVALAPVLYTMFGAGEQTGRQIIAALAVFIPVYLNTLRGLRQVRPVHRDLLRAYAATAWQATRTVTLPGAVPYIFTGLRIASSLAVISALVAEYFGGPADGLGKSITSAAAYSNYALAYAFVVGAIVLGLAFYLTTRALEEFSTRHRSAA